MNKRAISFLLVIAIALTIPLGAMAATVNGKNVAGQGLYVMDFETGVELYGHNADTAYVPASISKLMAVYLAYEAIENGELTLDSVVPVSEKVYRLSRDPNYYNTVPLSYDQTYYLGELIELILVYSASASVVAMAELVSGDEATFIDKMNDKAKEWNIDATFYGCSGIEDNYITPRAVAVLARRIITDFPQVLDITKKSSTVFHGVTYAATNNLLGSQYYEGADGLKSGTTTNAGYCFVATAVKNGVRLISVVMRSTSATQRYNDSHVLLDYGFSVRESTVREQTMRLVPFTDVYLDDWFADSVSAIVKTGLMKGSSETTFSPGDKLSRAMAITTLYRMAGSPAVTYKYVFSDVPSGQWFSDAVAWAYDNHIIEGYGHEIFGVDDEISRQQLAAMLYRYADYTGMDIIDFDDLSGFSDRAHVSDWGVIPIGWAVANGLVNGMGNGILSPGGATDRAQCATILLRFMKLSAAA